MKLVTKKSPRGRLFDELSPEQATAVGNDCGKGHVASLVEKQLAEAVLRSMRDNDLWLSCGCRTTAEDRPLNTVSNRDGSLFLVNFSGEHSSDCPLYRSKGVDDGTGQGGGRRTAGAVRIDFRSFLPRDDRRNDAGTVVCRDAYAHALFDYACPVPVDSNLERETINSIMTGGKWLQSLGYELSLNKPLFDITVDVDGEERFVLPDFLLTVKHPGRGRTSELVIETMGYTDDDYVERKANQHKGMSTLGLLLKDPPIGQSLPISMMHLRGICMGEFSTLNRIKNKDIE